MPKCAAPIIGFLLTTAAVAAPMAAGPDCDQGFLENWSGTGTVACPCFVQGEEVGAVFTAPTYPIKVLSVDILWASLVGGAPLSTEEAVHVYGGGLPDPGSPIYSYSEPRLEDGSWNTFVFGEESPIIESGPFTVTLEFRNTNAGDPFAPSVIHDGDGCIPGRNVIFAIPGGWNDACALGVSGNWWFKVHYEEVCTPCPADLDGDGTVDSFDLLTLLGAWGGSGVGDIDDNGTVETADLLLLLGAWGECV